MSATPKTPAQQIEEAGIKRPMNWDEMGSSEKDRWEERMLRSVARIKRWRERAK